MFRKLSIRLKITALTLLLLIITIALASFFAYQGRMNAMENRYLSSLSALADLKVRQIQDFVTDGHRSVDYLINHPAFASFDFSESEDDMGFGFSMDMDDVMDDDMDDDMMIDYDDPASSVISSLLKDPEHIAVIMSSSRGNIISAKGISASGHLRKVIPGFEVQHLKNGQMYNSTVFKMQDKYCLALGNFTNSKEGIVIIIKDLSNLYATLMEDLNLSGSIESILAQKQNKRAVFLNPLKSDPDAALDKGVFFEDKSVGGGIVSAVHGKEGTGYSIDYRGKKTLSSWRYMPVLDFGLEVKADYSELRREGLDAILKFLSWSVAVLIIGGFMTLFFSQFFIDPLLQLKESLVMLSRGILPEKVEKKYDDEVGEMAETTNELVQALRRTASFAERIGKGQFDADYKSLGESDVLGNALLEMRKSLQENEKRDAQRNWIVTGVAEISEILRSHYEISDLADEVIAFITEKIDAIQGAFYLVSDQEDGDGLIHMTAAYAYHKKKYIKASFRFAEGLVGQAAAEQDTVLRTEIPDDYVTITSGLLGDKRPKCLLITPMRTDEKVFGVLEFAGFTRFSERQIKFVEEISVIIARTIFNIQVNVRTRKLLQESQIMSNELKEQQEILRQNAEEMAATQEELRRTNQRLEDQIEEVNRTQNRMQLLLENASEVIAIYEENLSIRYISPSVEKILGYPQNDLIGINDKVNVHPDGVAFFAKMFEVVIRNPFETCSVQYEYMKKNGETVWLEATATNLLADPAIQGIVVNSRDITERRRAEQEERMRSKMQALSENSPDLITRLDHDGTFFYINPMIEHYTGFKPHDFLNRNIMEVGLNDGIKEEWMSILREVESRNEKVAKEMDFPSELGARVMQINAIPEYDENEKVESVLVVSHDITERKQIELEIQSKNKKITESINYAKRIQGAILPDNTVIRKFLPESFILYKARDVVSGDFPWFLRVNDVIYFAAVDCTGHGVPGALISLIGYFILNEIVKGRKITDPGQILDELDKGVTQTLRQDQDDSKTKDGMDIALCRIDLNTNEVAYAGAHRPLMAMVKGEMQEIKGNKFAIGGGVYKNQTNFTTTQLNLKKGDAIYFCSDGFTDQFGGPENRKFGPNRLRELIHNHYTKHMKDQYAIFDAEWEEWKGDHRQTDDVLLIGIKFS